MHVSLVGELDGRFLGVIRLLALAVAAIEKRVHVDTSVEKF